MKHIIFKHDGKYYSKDAATSEHAECKAPKGQSGFAFVRFGKFPELGMSWNSRDFRYEAGISVYPCEVFHGGFVVPIIARRDDTNFMTLDACTERVAIEVTGKMSGFGGDGEPVLVDVERIGYLSGILTRDVKDQAYI